MYNFSCALNESYAAQVTVVGGGRRAYAPPLRPRATAPKPC